MIFVILYSLFSQAAFAGDHWTCSTPELQNIVESITQKTFECPSLLPKGSDPHNAEISPSMITRLNGTCLLVSVGLSLEEGWLKKLLDSSNSKVKWDSPEHFQVGPSLDPAKDSGGHSHHGLDPHVLLSPARVSKLYNVLGVELSKHGCSKCEASGKKLSESSLQEYELLKKQIAASGITKVASYHGAFDYFLKDFNIDSSFKIEGPKGAPTLRQLVSISERLKSESIPVVLLEPSTPSGVTEKLRELNPKTKFIELPIGLTEGSAPDLHRLFSLYADRLTSH